jgi:hypothetical protein
LKLQTIAPRACAALFALLFVAFAGAGTPAFGQTTNETIPVTNTIFNQCNGDNVAFSGTMNVVNTMTTDANGGTHLKTHANYQNVVGTGTPSGIEYRVRTVSNEVINDDDGPQSTATVISTVKLIAQGPALDYYLRMVLHVTVNGNGETTSTVQELNFECRGRN